RNTEVAARNRLGRTRVGITTAASKGSWADWPRWDAVCGESTGRRALFRALGRRKDRLAPRRQRRVGGECRRTIVAMQFPDPAPASGTVSSGRANGVVRGGRAGEADRGSPAQHLEDVTVGGGLERISR